MKVLDIDVVLPPKEKRSIRSRMSAEVDDPAPSPKRRREAEPESETSSRIEAPEADPPRKRRHSSQPSHGAKPGDIVVGLPPDSDEEDLTTEELDMREVRNEMMLEPEITELMLFCAQLIMEVYKVGFGTEQDCIGLCLTS